MIQLKVVRKQRNLLVTILIASLAVLLLAAGAAYLGVRRYYQQQLKPLDTSASQQVFVVASGDSVKTIGQNLQDQSLIRNGRAFEWYVKGRGWRSKLQAGTYRLSASQSTQEIASDIVDGKVATDLFTILPAQRLDQIEAAFAKAGFSQTAIQRGIDINHYANHPVFAGESLPPTLEGYLYPESFQRISTTSVDDIVGAALDEMAKQLTAERRAQYHARGLSTYQAVTLASIVEQEVSNADDRKTVAQVFLSRLQNGMMLGSDVTYFYAAAITGQTASPSLDSPYNTRLHTGLPPGPISNVSKSSLEAVANPSSTDYLYFVTGDDGVTHFSHTQAEHDQAVQRYCDQLCRL